MSNTGVISTETLEGIGNPFASRYDDKTWPDGCVIRMFTGNLSDPADLATAEDLLSRSMECGGYLKKPGDIAVLERSGTFDKMGEYHIFLYYIELKEKKPAEKKEA